jgi:hypothetical protein
MPVRRSSSKLLRWGRAPEVVEVVALRSPDVVLDGLGNRASRDANHATGVLARASIEGANFVTEMCTAISCRSLP